MTLSRPFPDGKFFNVAAPYRIPSGLSSPRRAEKVKVLGLFISPSRPDASGSGPCVLFVGPCRSAVAVWDGPLVGCGYRGHARV